MKNPICHREQRVISILAVLLAIGWLCAIPIVSKAQNALIPSSTVQLSRPPKAGTAAVSDAAARARINAIYGKLPLSFEANRGQTDWRVKFLSRGHGYTLFLTPGEAVLAAHDATLRVRLAGGNRRPRIEGFAELPGKSNYFIGNDPAKWRTNVPTYSKIRYRDVYPGIDVVYHGNQQQLEYDFVVAPGC